jgi:thiosulfate sulfurtransferase
MRFVLAIAGIAVAAGVPHASFAQAEIATSSAEEQQVLAAEDEYVAAEVSRDEATLGRLVDARFVLNSSNGSTSGKEELIHAATRFKVVDNGRCASRRGVVQASGITRASASHPERIQSHSSLVGACMSDSNDVRRISAGQLASLLAENRPVAVLDVRRPSGFEKNPRLIPRAVRVPPDAVAEWARDNNPSVPVVTYCVHGHEVSQGAAAALQACGYQVAFLEGGITEWLSQGHETIASDA